MAIFKDTTGAQQGMTGLHGTDKPRICMPTARNFAQRTYRCSLYEAQDVLAEIDDVEPIYLEPRWGFQTWFNWHKRLLYRDVSRKLIFRNPGLRKVCLKKEYDLFVAVCQSYSDILYISAIEGWKDQCRTSVCWIDELWAAQVPQYRYWLDALRRFDHVFIGCRGTTEPLSKALGQPCRWLPGGVDALRFSPYPDAPARVIDVYSIGRRWDGIHQTLLRAAGDRDLFYVYDTFLAAADMEPYDYRHHRDLLANMAKRSRYFVVAPAKMNVVNDTHGQVEIGFRYFEGAAAGAVMIGQAPDCNAFREAFPWPDAVVPVHPDGSDVTEILGRLDSQPEQVRAMRLRNTTGALLHHDWVYRWKEILQVAGLDLPPGMPARERRLNDLANLAHEANTPAEARE